VTIEDGWFAELRRSRAASNTRDAGPTAGGENETVPGTLSPPVAFHFETGVSIIHA
jgi:hypothetical protein